MLSNKIALVTGASRGIGEAVAVALAAQGVEVVLVGRNVRELERVDDRIQALGGKTLLVPMDLGTPTLIEQLALSLNERYGKLDILVGNAAILGELRPLSHLTPQLWQDVFNTNLHANFHLMRCFEGLLRKAASGYATFITSDVASKPCAYWGAYGASKAALENMVETWRQEMAVYNVRVDLFNPGAVATRMMMQAMPGIDPEKLITPDQAAEHLIAQLLGTTPAHA